MSEKPRLRIDIQDFMDAELANFQRSQEVGSLNNYFNIMLNHPEIRSIILKDLLAIKTDKPIENTTINRLFRHIALAFHPDKKDNLLPLLLQLNLANDADAAQKILTEISQMFNSLKSDLTCTVNLMDSVVGDARKQQYAQIEATKKQQLAIQKFKIIQKLLEVAVELNGAKEEHAPAQRSSAPQVPQQDTYVPFTPSRSVARASSSSSYSTPSVNDGDRDVAYFSSKYGIEAQNYVQDLKKVPDKFDSFCKSLVTAIIEGENIGLNRQVYSITKLRTPGNSFADIFRRLRIFCSICSEPSDMQTLDRPTAALQPAKLIFTLNLLKDNFKDKITTTDELSVVFVQLNKYLSKKDICEKCVSDFMNFLGNDKLKQILSVDVSQKESFYKKLSELGLEKCFNTTYTQMQQHDVDSGIYTVIKYGNKNK